MLGNRNSVSRVTKENEIEGNENTISGCSTGAVLSDSTVRRI